MEVRLKRRTEAFRKVERYTPQAVEKFTEWVRSTEPQEKLQETVYICEFLGFLESECRKVGCLLQP